MTALPQQVLDALSPTKPIYAVLDGARDRRIGGWVSDTRAPAWCLWRGKLPAVVERVAPFLLRLERGREYTDRLFSVGWNHAWGVLLAGDVPSRELRRHLRRFLRVRTERGRIMTFRYYDPRVLRIFLPALSGTEAAAFFGPIETFAAAGESPDVFHVFRHNGPGVEERVISSVAGVQGVA